jgi:hypothetical protein
MIDAKFEDNNFTITIGLKKFFELWDDSYAVDGEYSLQEWESVLGMNGICIDLDSFVAEQVLSVLDNNGDEDESAGNEWFEDYDATACVVKSANENEIVIVGKLLEL